MSSAPKYVPHYTLADYQQWEGTWELWNGTAVAMTPSPFGKHQMALTRLAQRLLNALDEAGCEACLVAVELDWIIADDTIVRPDLSICCHGDIDRYIESAPTLVAEVLSDSTQHKDRTAKLELYERQGVKYYLIVDPADQSIDAHQLVDGRYQPLATQPQLTLQLHEGCEIQVK